MPKRTDIQTVLIIGAGPIIIGQACEFDYSGVQACKALRPHRCDMQSLATELGFSDTANFYHAFKRWQGCAPGQYRKAYQSAFQQESGKPPVHGSHV